MKDVITGSSTIKEPVIAEDGRLYERASLLAWFAAREEEGLPICSPADQGMSMGKGLKECTEVPPSMASEAEAGAQGSLAHLGGLRAIFDLLLPLPDLLATTLDGWVVPTVVVFGTTGGGTSTLVERLANVPLPRDEVTRLPLTIRLRHSDEAQLPTLRVLATGGDLIKERRISLEMADAIIAEETRAMLAEMPADGLYEKRHIELHVRSPATAHIDVVDLPGLKVAPSHGEAGDAPARVKDFVKRQLVRYKKEPHSTFVAAVHASSAPNVSLAMELVAELGLEDSTIGAITMCDDAGKRNLKALPARLSQSAHEIVALELGYVATMAEPAESDEEVGHSQRLRQLPADELEWFAAQPMLQPMLAAADKLTISALVRKLNTRYLDQLRQTWAPQTLYRLREQSASLRRQSEALGLPEAADPRDHHEAQLDELIHEALAATSRVLDCAMGSTLQRSFLALSPIRGALAAPPPSSFAELRRIQQEIFEATQRSHSLFVGGMKEALLSDTSSFILSRFPRFIEAAVARVAEEVAVTSNGLIWKKNSMGALLRAAAASVDATGWVEACAEERLRLRALARLTTPIERQTLEMLGLTAAEEMPALVALEQVDLVASRLEGDGLSVAAAGAESRFLLRGLRRDGGLARAMPFTATLTSPRKQRLLVRATVEERIDGSYVFGYTPPAAEAAAAAAEKAPRAMWRLEVTLHGQQVGGSPFEVEVAATRAMLYAVGGATTGVAPPHAAGELAERYDANTNSWEVVPADSAAHHSRDHLGLAEFDGSLYVVGGCEGCSCLSAVEKFDAQAGQWNSLAALGGKRSHLGVGLVEPGVLYAVGGYAGGSCRLSSVEKYDIAEDRWSAAAELTMKREALGVGVVEGTVYAVGGRNDEGEQLRSVERYNAARGVWEKVASMGTCRVFPGVGSLGGSLYVLGGSDSMGNVLSSAERYDPLRNVWSPLPPMSTKRQALGVAVLGGMVYALGGRDSNNKPLQSVERLDVHSGVWEAVASMHYARHAFGVAVCKV